MILTLGIEGWAFGSRARTSTLGIEQWAFRWEALTVGSSCEVGVDFLLNIASNSMIFFHHLSYFSKLSFMDFNFLSYSFWFSLSNKIWSSWRDFIPLSGFLNTYLWATYSHLVLTWARCSRMPKACIKMSFKPISRCFPFSHILDNSSRIVKYKYHIQVIKI